MSVPPESSTKCSLRLPWTSIWYWSLNGVGFLVATVGTGLAIAPNLGFFNSVNRASKSNQSHNQSKNATNNKSAIINSDLFKINFLPTKSNQRQSNQISYLSNHQSNNLSSYQLRLLPLPSQGGSINSDEINHSQINQQSENYPISQQTDRLVLGNSADKASPAFNLDKLKIENNNLPDNLPLTQEGDREKIAEKKNPIISLNSAKAPSQHIPKYPAIFSQSSSLPANLSPASNPSSFLYLPIQQAVHLALLDDNQQKKNYLHNLINASNQNQKSSASSIINIVNTSDWVNNLRLVIDQQKNQLSQANLSNPANLFTNANPQQTEAIKNKKLQIQRIISVYLSALEAQQKQEIARLELQTFTTLGTDKQQLAKILSLEPSSDKKESQQIELKKYLQISRINFIATENQRKKNQQNLLKTIGINENYQLQLDQLINLTNNKTNNQPDKLPVLHIDEIQTLTQIAINNQKAAHPTQFRLKPQQFSANYWQPKIQTQVNRINTAYLQIQQTQQTQQQLSQKIAQLGNINTDISNSDISNNISNLIQLNQQLTKTRHQHLQAQISYFNSWTELDRILDTTLVSWQVSR